MILLAFWPFIDWMESTTFLRTVELFSRSLPSALCPSLFSYFTPILNWCQVRGRDECPESALPRQIRRLKTKVNALMLDTS